MKITAFIIAFFASSNAFAAETKKTPGELRATLKRQLQDSPPPTTQGGDGVGGDGEGGDGESGTPCFSAFNNVEVQGKGFVSMDSVMVGDHVRASNDDFSRVFSLAHLDHDLETDFLQIYSEGLSKPLEITAMHMVFSSGKAVRADEVSVGDMLDNNKVTEIKSVKRTGVYAPVTESGEIVVSGVRASSYPSFMDNIPFDQHKLVHFFLGPRRLMCSYDFGVCENEQHTDGYTNFAHWAIKIVERSNEFITPVQVFLASLALPVLTAAYCFEQMILSPVSTLAVGTFMLYKMSQKTSN